MHGLIGNWLDTSSFYTLIEIWQVCIIGVNINNFCYNFLYTRINTNYGSFACMGHIFFSLAERIVRIFLLHLSVLHRILQSLYTNVGKVNDRCQVHSSQLSLDGILRTRD